MLGSVWEINGPTALYIESAYSQFPTWKEKHAHFQSMEQYQVQGHVLILLRYDHYIIAQNYTLVMYTGTSDIFSR